MWRNVDKRLIIAIVLVLVLLMSSRYIVKAGASPSAEPEIEYARRVLARIWSRNGLLLTVTSGRDGTHSAQSLHYLGLAEDYRTRDIPSSTLQAMVSEARAALGPNYDLVIESDHLHVEYDPK